MDVLVEGLRREPAADHLREEHHHFIVAVHRRKNIHQAEVLCKLCVLRRSERAAAPAAFGEAIGRNVAARRPSKE
jgi:hypothetical protein